MRLVPETSSLARWLALPVALLAGAGLLAARHWPGLAALPPVCTLRTWTGLACPTCGATRAAVDLAAGRAGAAFAANPLVPLAALAVLLWTTWAAAAAIRPGLRRRVRLGPTETRAARILAALLLLALWARQALLLAG